MSLVLFFLSNLTCLAVVMWNCGKGKTDSPGAAATGAPAPPKATEQKSDENKSKEEPKSKEAAKPKEKEKDDKSGKTDQSFVQTTKGNADETTGYEACPDMTPEELAKIAGLKEGK